MVWHAASQSGDPANQNRDGCITKSVSRARTMCLNFSLITKVHVLSTQIFSHNLMPL